MLLVHSSGLTGGTARRRMFMFALRSPTDTLWLLVLLVVSTMSGSALAFGNCHQAQQRRSSQLPLFKRKEEQQLSYSAQEQGQKTINLFEDFVEFLKSQQNSIIDEIENGIEKNSGEVFSRDCWGVFEDEAAATTAAVDADSTKSGGITRVIQGGDCIEKGACSLTVIEGGILTPERAANIRSRQRIDDKGDVDDTPGSVEAINIAAGDTYSAAALSMVLHSRSPMVPTFRSDVRVFLVTDKDTGESWAWFGGGADLTPYYLFQGDIRFFHGLYAKLCSDYGLEDDDRFSYAAMKEACDKYFYLPARKEHRGTGGIFFDDMPLNDSSLSFVKGVTMTWMPSWLPIVDKRAATPYTKQQKQWQKLRRGRYLEFNLLYDRGVKFGLMVANPRVEGIMVSAPPQIAYFYRHEVEPDSPEANMLNVLREPQAWV